MKEADCNDLFEKAFKIKLSGKKLKKLEKEYLHKKEKQATENSQLIRLQDDNVELDKRVIALEKECAALADRLLQEQVGRKRENEEVSALRTELTQLRKKVAVFEKQDSQTHNTHETSKELRNRAVSDPLLRININHSPILKGSLFNDIKEDDEQINDSAIPESPSPVSSPIVDTANILKELATVKIEKVECMDLLERKSMEFKKLQQKHNKLQSELEKVTVKLKKLKKSKKSKNSFVCPNCGTKSKSKLFSNAGASDIYTEEEDETDGQYREILAGLKDMLDNPLSPVSPDNKDVSVNDNCMELKVTQV
jgi:predicted  nucleic acid-binding Zn-ribbon protein